MNHRKHIFYTKVAIAVGVVIGVILGIIAVAQLP